MSPLTTGHARTAPNPHARDLTAELDQIARQIYRALAHRGIDLTPAHRLADSLDVPETVLRAAVARTPYLGLCETALDPMVFCLPPQPLAAGFLAEVRGRHLALRLLARGRPALLLSGRQVGPVPAAEREETIGSGELAHLVSRLTLMAASWLPPAAMSPTRLLFELIASGWRSGSRSRDSGELAVHQADFDQPIAWGPIGSTRRLELVTHYHGGTHQLVNIYPSPREA
jgi:hypothetical protein